MEIKLSMNKLSSTVQSMRSAISRAKLHICRKMVDDIKALSKKVVGNKPKQGKFSRKILRLTEEIHCLRYLKPNEIACFALSHSEEAAEKLRECPDVTPKERALAKISLHKMIKPLVVEFHKKYPKWEDILPKLLNRELNKNGNSENNSNNNSINEISNKTISEDIILVMDPRFQHIVNDNEFIPINIGIDDDKNECKMVRNNDKEILKKSKNRINDKESLYKKPTAKNTSKKSIFKTECNSDKERKHVLHQLRKSGPKTLEKLPRFPGKLNTVRDSAKLWKTSNIHFEVSDFDTSNPVSNIADSCLPKSSDQFCDIGNKWKVENVSLGNSKSKNSSKVRRTKFIKEVERKENAKVEGNNMKIINNRQFQHSTTRYSCKKTKVNAPLKFSEDQVSSFASDLEINMSKTSELDFAMGKDVNDEPAYVSRETSSIENEHVDEKVDGLLNMKPIDLDSKKSVSLEEHSSPKLDKLPLNEDPFFLTKDNKKYMTYGQIVEETKELPVVKKSQPNVLKKKWSGNNLFSKTSKPDFNRKNDVKFRRSYPETNKNLHPSWAAKKKITTILPFQGKKISFED